MYCNRIILILDDVCDNLRDAVAELGLKAKCIGGGRMEHFPDAKKIKIYGFSDV